MIVPSKRLSITDPSRAPPAVDTVPSSAAAMPATCGSGSIAAVLLSGSRIATTGSRVAMATPNTTIGGSPPNPTATSIVSTAAPARAAAPRRIMPNSPMRSTSQALINDPSAMNNASTPKMIGNSPSRPNTSSTISCELPMYAVMIPYKQVSAIAKPIVGGDRTTSTAAASNAPRTGGRRRSGGSVSGSRRAQHATPTAASPGSQNSVRHGANARIAAPTLGAIAGTRMNDAMMCDIVRAIRSPA